MIREVFNGCGSSFLPGMHKSAGARHTVAWYGETRLRKTCRAVGLAKAEAYVAASFMVLLKQIARARQSGATAAVRPSFRCNAQRYTPDGRAKQSGRVSVVMPSVTRRTVSLVRPYGSHTLSRCRSMVCFAPPAEARPTECCIFFLFRVSVEVPEIHSYGHSNCALGRRATNRRGSRA
jgi:hypothetical protein